MTDIVDMHGHRVAVSVSGAAVPEAVDGGLLLPAGRVSLLHGLGDGLFYRHGQNSWSPCGWRRLSDAPLRIADPKRRLTADDAAWDDPCRHHSSAVAAVQGPDGGTLLLGALGLDTPRLSADQDTMVGWYEKDGAGWYLSYGAEDEVFASYARQLANRLGSRHRRIGNIWCSWYAYYEQIDESLLAQDLRAISKLPIDVVQVDDGWQKAVGDWRPNGKFPSGMRALAEKILGAGLIPGLWLAPFAVLPDSDIALRFPDMLLRDEHGQSVVAGYNWSTGYFALDLSREDARAHVADTVDRVVHEWGFRYLKLDFLNAAMAPGVRTNPMGREEAYREGLLEIRRAAGDDVYLLGSGAVLLPSLGLMDGLRCGPDVAPFWKNSATTDPSDAMARNAVVNTLHRLWQSPLLELDPDVVYFRSRQNLLSEEQMLWLRDLADICDFRAVSDPPGWLSSHELNTMIEYLSRKPKIEKRGRYEFVIDGRRVDFAPAIGANGHREDVQFKRPLVHHD